MENEPLAFTTGDRIELQLEVRTRSVEDQNSFVGLLVDDYRYDEPNYFTDHRVPNISFEVTKNHGSLFQPVPFRVSSQGGGVSWLTLVGTRNVSTALGGDALGVLDWFRRTRSTSDPLFGKLTFERPWWVGQGSFREWGAGWGIYRGGRAWSDR